MTFGPPRRDRLCDREASCVLFEAFDAEQLFADGFPAIPGRVRRGATDDEAYE
jgi:hypothetical protein